ncbi:unnamed protein product, partial [Scytosiphon promiscuus]
GEVAGGGPGGGKLGRLRRAYEELQAQLDDLRVAHERLRLDSASEIRKLRREAREGAKAVEMGADATGRAEEQAAVLREELDDCELRLKQAREKHRGEAERLSKDLERERASSRAMRAKIRDFSGLRGRTSGPDPRAYNRGGRSPSPFGGKAAVGAAAGKRGGTGTGPTASFVGRSRSAGSSRRFADSPSGTRSAYTSGWKSSRLGRPNNNNHGANTSSYATTAAGGLGSGRRLPRRADSPRHAPKRSNSG